MIEPKLSTDIVPRTPQAPEQALVSYRETVDEDAKAAILNTSLVVKTDGIAHSDSVALVRSLAEDEESQAVKYRPDAINALNGKNLVSIANEISGAKPPEDEDERAEYRLIGVARLIRRLATPIGGESELQKRDRFEESVLDEITERLNGDSGDPEEEGEIIDALDENLTPELFRRIIEEKPDLLAAMLMHVQEFSNEELRKALLRAAATQISEPTSGDPDEPEEE